MDSQTPAFRQRRLEAARGYLILGMPECALRELKLIKRPEFCRFECLLLEAEALRDLSRYDDAIPVFEEALVHSPRDLQVFLGLAWCYKRIGRLDQAIQTLEAGKEYHPEEPIVIYNLACYYSLSGDKPKAIECLGRSLRMEPQLRQLIPGESDFDQLRTDPDFQFVTDAG